MGAVLDVLGGLPKKNEKITDTGSLNGTVAVSAFLVIALIAVLVIVSKK